MTSPRFEALSLQDLATSLLDRAGVPFDAADLVARSLIAADASGIHSHGLLRLPLYLRAVTAGGIDPTAQPEVIRLLGGVHVLEGHGAFGQVVMQHAVDLALEAVPEHGIVSVAVQGSSHFGAGRFWTDQLAERGIAAILTSTTGPIAAPFGGAEPILGTNPLTISLPSAGPGPLVADLATTAGAYGRVVAARNEGQTIPEGWGVDSSARPTTDPAAVLDGGALVPFGGHKGSGISVLLEGLSAALTSAAFAMNTVDIWQDQSSRMNTGHLLLALDTAAFGDPEAVAEKVADLQHRVRDSGADDDVLSPGDLEHTRRTESREGVPLAESTVDELRKLAEAQSLPFPDPLTPTPERSPR